MSTNHVLPCIKGKETKHVDKNRFIRNHLFRKTFFGYVERTRRQEHISSGEADSSWKNVEKMFSASAVGQPVRNRRILQRRPVLFITSSVASFLLIIALSCWGTHIPIFSVSPENEIQWQHVSIPKGESSQILLPDGTRVYANAGSRISYPSAFRKDCREISIEGEVYLEVTHNAHAPFIVKANGFTVRVLGTKFNVSAYPGEKSASVVLVQGSVQIETVQKEKILLHPNELADITPEGTCTRQVDVSRYISWKDHFILLDEEKLGEVLKQLSTYYGMDFRCDTDVTELPLSGKLKLANSAEEMIGILHKTTRLNYAKSNDGYRLYK